MSNKKNKAASALGSVLEWYDFSLYGFFAPLLASIYFPSSTPLVSLLKIFGVFAIGFFARPVGALLFGYISDKYGRTLTLKITPWLITISTSVLVFIPSYSKIGVTASILVCLLRIAQGICIGGEYSNNMIYLCEIAESKYTYFYGSLGSCSGNIGILLASSVTTLCYVSFKHDFLIEWGWKLAFLSSIFFGVLTGIMRRNLAEPPVFNSKNKNNSFNPISLSIKQHKIDYLLA
jgi:MHS family proline/betaine transporter-like MFS transporter